MFSQVLEGFASTLQGDKSPEEFFDDDILSDAEGVEKFGAMVMKPMLLNKVNSLLSAVDRIIKEEHEGKDAFLQYFRDVANQLRVADTIDGKVLAEMAKPRFVNWHIPVKIVDLLWEFPNFPNHENCEKCDAKDCPARR